MAICIRWYSLAALAFSAAVPAVTVAQGVVYSNLNVGGTFFSAFQNSTEWDDLQLEGGGLLSELSFIARRNTSPPQFASGFFDLRVFDEAGNFPQGDPLGVIPFSGSFGAAPDSPFFGDVLIELTGLESMGIVLPENGKIGLGVNFDQADWGLIPASPPTVGSSPGGNWIDDSPFERNDFGVGLPYRLTTVDPTPVGPGVGNYPLFVTADATPDDPVQNSGVFVDEEFFTGIGFNVKRRTQISEVGAYLTSGSGTVFAAIVPASSTFVNLNESDIAEGAVLGSTLLELPTGFGGGDVSAELDLTLEPGAYFLMLGSDRFGASGDGLLRDEHDGKGNWPTRTVRVSDSLNITQIGEHRLFVIADSAPGTVQARPTFDTSARVADGMVQVLIDGGDIIVSDNGASADEIAVFEFPLSDLPAGREVIGASLEVDVNLVTSGPLAFDVIGYAGDGLQQPADGIAGDTVIGVAGIDGLGIMSIDLDEAFIESLRDGSLGDPASHLGIRIVPTGSGNFRFRTLESGQSGDPALLTLNLSPADPTLAGDYNGDGVVDSIDYAVWRESLGDMGVDLAADGNGDEIVNGEDFTIWQENYGATSPAPATTTSAPEPAAAVLVIMGALAAASHCRRFQ